MPVVEVTSKLNFLLILLVADILILMAFKESEPIDTGSQGSLFKPDVDAASIPGGGDKNKIFSLMPAVGLYLVAIYTNLINIFASEDSRAGSRAFICLFLNVFGFIIISMNLKGNNKDNNTARKKKDDDIKDEDVESLNDLREIK